MFYEVPFQSMPIQSMPFLVVTAEARRHGNCTGHNSDLMIRRFFVIMISTTAEYALRAITFLAAHPHDPKTAVVIARETQVPVGYLAKVMYHLTKSGLVDSQRGIHGGFTLAGDSKTLRVYDVVQSIDPIVRIEQCPLGLKEHGRDLCPLHRGLDNVMAAAETAYKQMSILQLIKKSQAKQPPCSFPRLE